MMQAGPFCLTVRKDFIMPKNIEKKLRIQLFSPEFDMVGDRLVSQDTEIRKGPTEIHEGPMRIEVSLFAKDDVELFKAYLDKLIGTLPLEEKVSKKRTKLESTPENLRLEIVNELKDAENTKDFQETMQDYGFMPISLDLLKDMDYPVKVEDIHREYTFWVKRIKKAKNPINHRYDVSIIVGILSDNIVIYDGIEVIESIKLADASTKLQKIPKYIKLKFPHYIHQDERNRLRFEIEALTEDEEQEASKFYKRWVWDVQKVNEKIELPRINSIDNPYK